MNQATGAKPWVAKIGVPILLIAGNVAPIYLLWLLWPRLVPCKADAGPEGSRLMIDLFLALIFPLQHSILTQAPVKRAVTRSMGELLERPFYVVTSAIALVATVFFWRASSREIWAASPVMVWIARGIFIGIAALQVWCANIVGPKFLTGVTHLKALASGRPLRAPEFREIGPYRSIRHPIAMTQVLSLWMVGSLYADRLLLAVVWSLWIITATALEDRRLENEFGETYREYRGRAGFMWPKFSRTKVGTTTPAS